MLTLFREQGYVKTRGRQRTDSTHILAAIQVRNRLENIGESLRHALNVLATTAPERRRTPTRDRGSKSLIPPARKRTGFLRLLR